MEGGEPKFVTRLKPTQQKHGARRMESWTGTESEDSASSVIIKTQPSLRLDIVGASARSLWKNHRTPVYQYTDTFDELQSSLKKHVNQYSPAMSRDFSIAGWLSSTMALWNPRDSSVIFEKDNASSEPSCSASSSWANKAWKDSFFILMKEPFDRYKGIAFLKVREAGLWPGGLGMIS